MNPVTLAIALLAVFAAGVVVGRKYEQKIVAKVLTDFARVDANAKSLVNRCYVYLTSGVKAELKKLGGI